MPETLEFFKIVQNKLHYAASESTALEGAGTVSHEQTIEKAHGVYDRYRAQLADELTDVEKAYLETLKDMQKRLKDGGNE